MVTRERTVRVHATIPVSQADALKALAAASGVPLARAVHYAVERLLDVARREGALAVAGGLAPVERGRAGDDSVAEVAAALDLRVPEPDPESRESVVRNGEPVLAPAADRERDRDGDPPAEQVAEHGGAQQGAQDAVQPDDQGSEHRSAQATGPPVVSPAAPSGAVAAAPPG